MKKLGFYSLAAVGALLMASCSSDDVGLKTGEGTTFTVKLPRELGSRGSFGDGTDAGDRATLNSLLWTVYQVDDSGNATYLFDGEETAPFTQSQTEQKVTINLAKGKKYQVVFYAANSGNNFATYDPATGSMSVNYTNAVSNTANEDVFVGKSSVVTVSETGVTEDPVTLRRPFAQLNWGTNDLTSPAIQGLLADMKATVTISNGLYQAYDIMNDTFSDPVAEGTTYSFGEIACQSKTEGGVTTYYFAEQSFPTSVPVAEGENPYSLVAMNYILVDNENAELNCTLSFSDTDIQPITVFGANVKPNYRTNIYGSFFTAPGIFNIVVDNNFENGDINKPYPEPLPAWDGTTKTQVTPVSKVINGVATDVYVAKQPSDLAGLIDDLNSGAVPMDAYIQLDADMDFDNKPLTAIADVSRAGLGAGGFTGTLDGQDHVLRNLNISATQDNYSAALIAVTKNATVKNVNIEGGTITSADAGAAVVGAMFGETTISNCNVSGMTINADQAAGGIAGRAYGSKNVITNCTNSSTVNGSSTSAKTGGIVGIISLGAGEISNCVNTGEIGGVGNAGAAGIAGYVGYSSTISNCRNEGAVGVNGSLKYAAGIAGYLNAATTVLTITNCTNTAEIKATSHAAGIFAMVGSYGPSYISGCSNSGNITSDYMAGGIAGQKGAGDVENCINTGSVTATQIAGGVVGADNRGNIYDCQGGSAAITAPTAGRVLGAANCGNGYINQLKLIAEGNSYADGMKTIGSVGIGTALTTAKILSGELIGTPTPGGNSGDKIVIAEGASWDLFPGQTGTFTYKNGNWQK